MNLEEYFEEAASLSAVTTEALTKVVNPFKAVALSWDGWLDLLAAVWPTVNDARFDAGKLSRRYYDHEREKHIGARKDVWISTLDPDDFQDQMSEYRAEMSSEDTTDDQADKFVSGMIRTVDNGGRSTLISAAYEDDECAWARVEGGNDGSCAWCTLQISRGPVFKSSDAAGASYSWHRSCNCRVVPVFDPRSWPGRDNYLEAERLYKEAARQDGDTLSNLRKLTR